MNCKLVLLMVFVNILYFTADARRHKKPVPWKEYGMDIRYVNKNYINDRPKKNFRPTMDEKFEHRFKQKYSPGWMDYCDPYHCNDYHHRRCGLHRNTMKFRWFQSACHISLNNQCAKQNGNMKFDTVADKFCTLYVMYFRTGCPKEEECAEHPMEKICGKSRHSGELMIFLNKCYFQFYNCKPENFEEYDEVSMEKCEPSVPLLDREVEMLPKNSKEVDSLESTKNTVVIL